MGQHSQCRDWKGGPNCTLGDRDGKQRGLGLGSEPGGPGGILPARPRSESQREEIQEGLLLPGPQMGLQAGGEGQPPRPGFGGDGSEYNQKSPGAVNSGLSQAANQLWDLRQIVPVPGPQFPHL